MPIFTAEDLRFDFSGVGAQRVEATSINGTGRLGEGVVLSPRSQSIQRCLRPKTSLK